MFGKQDHHQPVVLSSKAKQGERHVGLALFDRMTSSNKGTALFQGSRENRPNDKEALSDDKMSKTDLAMIMGSQIREYSGSINRSHYHAASLAWPDLVGQIFSENIRKENSLMLNALECSHTMEASVLCHEKPYLYDSECRDDLDDWFHSMMITPSTLLSSMSNSCTSFSYANYLSQREVDHSCFFVTLLLHSFVEPAKSPINSDTRIIRVKQRGLHCEEQVLFGCEYKKRSLHEDLMLLKVEDDFIFLEFSLISKENVSLFSGRSSLVSNLKASMSSLKRSAAFTTGGTRSAAAEKKDPMMVEYGTSSFRMDSLKSGCLRNQTVRIFDHSGRQELISFSFDINIIAPALAKKPSEPAWDTLESLQGFISMFTFVKEPKIPFWKRFHAEFAGSKVAFYDFLELDVVHQELDLKEFAVAKLVSAEKCALSHAFALVFKTGQTILLKADSHELQLKWMEAINARIKLLDNFTAISNLT